MSNQVLTATSPLFKPGRNGNIEFLSSWKRLEKEQPEVFKQVRQEEGFICQDHEYEYKVGKNQYGLWLSRRKMGLDGLKQIEYDTGKPSPRPDLTVTPPSFAPPMSALPQSADSTMVIMALTQLADSIKLLALSNICSTDEEREQVRKGCMAQ